MKLEINGTVPDNPPPVGWLFLSFDVENPARHFGVAIYKTPGLRQRFLWWAFGFVYKPTKEAESLFKEFDYGFPRNDR